MEAACCGDGSIGFDVGTAAGHVGGDGDAAGLAGFGDDVCFALVLAGIEDPVLDAIERHDLAEPFAFVDRACADEDRAAIVAKFFDHAGDFAELGFFVGEDEVGHLVAFDGSIRGNADDPEFVNAPDFEAILHGCAGHACEMGI